MDKKEIDSSLAKRLVKIGIILGIITFGLYFFQDFVKGWNLTRQQRISIYLVALILELVILVYCINLLLLCWKQWRGEKR